MRPVSEDELAARSGVDVAEIRRLTDLGLLARRELDGPYHLGDVQRVRLAEAMARSGLPLEAIGQTVRDGHLSLAFIDVLFPDPVGVGGQTYAEMAASLGLDVTALQRIYIAFGLPPPGPDAPVREDDAGLLPNFVASLAAAVDPAGVVRVARFFGENLRRLAESEVRFFHTSIEEPILRSGMSERDMLELGAQMSSQLRPLVDGLVHWLHARHLEHYIVEDVLEHVENAVEEAGLRRDRPEEMPAMVFLDLTGYTRLTEERGDQAAAELAARLGELVEETSLHHGGRPIKWLGDGVMFHFVDPAGAVRCSLELVDATPGQGLPPAHVGIHAGPVVYRDGDYYGRTVNLAARIAAYAGPGQVLVSGEVHDRTVGGGLSFEEIGPVALKGLAKPVTLHQAIRPG